MVLGVCESMACVKGTCPQDSSRDWNSHVSVIQGHYIKGLTHERKDVAVRALEAASPVPVLPQGAAIWTVHPKGGVGAASQCSLMPPVRPLSSVSTLTPQMAFGICQLQAKQGSKILGRLTTRASPWPG